MRALILVALGAGCAGEGTLVVLPAQPTGVHRAGGLAGVAGAGGPSASPDADGFALAIEQPAAGSQLERSPVRVAGVASGVSSVLVAGREVAVTEGRFAARLPLPDGAHIVTVSAGPRALEVAFSVDAGGPEIELTAPPRGLFHDPAAQGDDVWVRGSVRDIGSHVAGLQIAGRDVAWDAKGAFEVRVTPPPGLSTIRVVATDGAGHVSSAQRSVVSGRFEPVDAPVDRALDVELGRAGLDALVEQAREALEATPLEELAPMGRSGDFELTSFSYEATDVDLTPDLGGFDIRVRIHGLRVGVRVEKRVLFIPVVIRGSASADVAELSAFLSVMATSDGAVAMDLGDASVDLRGFRYDIEGLPGLLEGLLAGVVRDLAEGALEDAVEGVVMPSLFDPADLVQPVRLGEATLTVAMKLSLLTVSPEGLRFQAAVSASAADLGPVAPERPAAPGAICDVAAGAGRGGPEGPLRVSVSADALNRLLHVAWRAGALDMSVDLGGDGGAAPIQLDVAGIGAALGAPLDEVAPGDAPVTLSLRPLLPPVLVPAPVGDPTKAATLAMGDMMLELLARPPGRDPLSLLSVALAIEADLPSGDPGEERGLADLRIHADLDASAVDVRAEAVEEGVARLLALAAPLLQGALADASGGDERPGDLTLVDALFGSDGGALVIAGGLGLNDAGAPAGR